MPADIDQRAALEGDRKLLSVRAEIRWRSIAASSRTDTPEPESDQIAGNSRSTAIAAEANSDENVPDVADLSREAEVRPPGT